MSTHGRLIAFALASAAVFTACASQSGFVAGKQDPAVQNAL